MKTKQTRWSFETKANIVITDSTAAIHVEILPEHKFEQIKTIKMYLLFGETTQIHIKRKRIKIIK